MSRLSDLGEKAVVGEVISRLASQGVMGVGDDAACIRLGSRYLVVSTDLISKRTHIPDRMTFRQIGWMATAVNLSDLAAMGATPIGVVMAMGLPRELDNTSMMEIVDGIMECCGWASASYLGGDTKETPEITIAGTSFGIVRSDGLLRRSGARPGDLLAVTGTVGLAGAGFLEMDLDEFDEKARSAALEPRPRIKEGTIMSSSGAVTSCMDTSDGLAMSVHELAGASRVGFEVFMKDIPIDPSAARVCRRMGVPTEEVALFSGGDYQLLFTVDPSELGKLRSMLGDGFKVIGRAVEPEAIVLVDGPYDHLPRKGYEHFKG
ncbi:MAG: thiamine-phosphate kinase [Methanomassiliicoccales archaeon]|nr:MAG: thiamine-phosphate kinase [Methanomassiliicoccales archaeon]